MSLDTGTNPPDDTSLLDHEQDEEMGPPAAEAGAMAEGATGALEPSQAVEDASAEMAVCQLEPQPSAESVDSGSSSSGAAGSGVGVGGALFADQVRRCPALMLPLAVALPQPPYLPPQFLLDMQCNTCCPAGGCRAGSGASTGPR